MEAAKSNLGEGGFKIGSPPMMCKEDSNPKEYFPTNLISKGHVSLQSLDESSSALNLCQKFPKGTMPIKTNTNLHQQSLEHPLHQKLSSSLKCEQMCLNGCTDIESKLHIEQWPESLEMDESASKCDENNVESVTDDELDVKELSPHVCQSVGSHWKHDSVNGNGNISQHVPTFNIANKINNHNLKVCTLTENIAQWRDTEKATMIVEIVSENCRFLMKQASNYSSDTCDTNDISHSQMQTTNLNYLTIPLRNQVVANTQFHSYNGVAQFTNGNGNISTQDEMEVNKLQIHPNSMNHLKGKCESVKEDTLKENGGRGLSYNHL